MNFPIVLYIVSLANFTNHRFGHGTTVILRLPQPRYMIPIGFHLPPREVVVHQGEEVEEEVEEEDDSEREGFW